MGKKEQGGLASKYGKSEMNKVRMAMSESRRDDNESRAKYLREVLDAMRQIVSQIDNSLVPAIGSTNRTLALNAIKRYLGIFRRQVMHPNYNSSSLKNDVRVFVNDINCYLQYKLPNV